jgi:hypothetical protein
MHFEKYLNPSGKVKWLIASIIYNMLFDYYAKGMPKDN